MAKSTLDILIRTLQNGLMSPNEVRIMEGLEQFPSRISMLDKPKVYKIVCGHCSRPNGIDDEVCESCGAPLPVFNEVEEMQKYAASLPSMVLNLQGALKANDI